VEYQISQEYKPNKTTQNTGRQKGAGHTVEGIPTEVYPLAFSWGGQRAMGMAEA
jgi:hypothetical protein